MPAWARFGLAAGVSSGALALQLRLEPLIGNLPYFLLYPAFFLVVTFLGMGPALLSIFLLGIGSDYIFIEPRFHASLFEGQANPSALLRLGIFVSVTLITTAAIQARHRAARRAAERRAASRAAEDKRRQLADSAEKHRRLEEHFRIAQELSLDAFTILTAVRDESGQVVDFVWEYVNPEAARVLEHPASYLEGRRLLEVLPGNRSQSSLFARYVRAVETGEPHDLEIAYDDGRIGGWFRNMCVKVGDGVAVYFSDITERKQNEATLWEAAERLNEAVKARDTFLSIASHELRTPLTSLMLQTQTLQRALERDDPRALGKERIAGFVDKSERQVARLARLVDDMFDVGRMAAGSLTLKREPFDLRDLLRDVVARMEHDFAALGVAPVFTRCESAPGAWDRMRLEQVVVNLLTNALRYGRGGAIELEVGRHGAQARVAVRDHGRGIPKEIQAKIFERYERAVPASEVSGLGLGLYIARQIVTAHDGRIWVESEPGAGAAFFVELPGAAPA
jgi:two-component system CheB/CheR fusion protein